MNYYSHHLGDYLRDTSHLSILEDGAYRRLLDIYYIREQPLPADMKECCKLARASSKAEREAVSYVLRQFFECTADGYRQHRADDEIARYADKQRKASASANARWKSSERNANASDCDMRTHMRTHCEGNAHQEPITNTSVGSTEASTQDLARATAAGRACLAMRSAGCGQTNPSHPDLLAAIAEGVPAEALADTVREGIGRSPPVTKPFAWAIATARSRHAAGTAPPIAGDRHAASPSSRKLSAVEQVEAAIHARRSREANGQPPAAA